MTRLILSRLIVFPALFWGLLLLGSASSFAGATAPQKPFLNIHEVTSTGGLTAWLVEDHSLPMLSIAFAFSGAGSVNDPADKQGLARIVSNTLDEGAGPYDSRAFQAALEDNAIALSYNAGRDDFYGTLKTLDATRDQALTLLRLSLTAPRFEAEPLARMVQGNIARIKGDMIDPDWVSARLMNDRAFAGTPYAQNSGGTLSTLPRLTPADLKAFHRTQLTRARLKIGVVGNIKPEDLAVLLDQVFGGLPAGTAQAEPVVFPLQNQGKTFVIPRDMPQTVFSLMMPAPARGAPDEIPTEVMNHILGGGGFGSRLMDQIREKAGLTYGIYSGITQMDRISTLGIGASTRKDQYPRMWDMLSKEVTRLKDKGITQKELDDAKGYMLGSMPLQLTSTDRIAGLLLSLQLENRPIGYLDTYRAQLAAVTKADVNKAAHNWLDLSRAVVVLVGGPEGLNGAETVSTLPNAE